MFLRNIERRIVAGIATGVLMIGAQSVLAADSGTVTGVVSDASGKPVAGAFVKLKNDQKRLTFMVISRDQGRFEAKDLPPGQYRVQGVAGENQSEWFSNVTVTATGEDAKVGLLLTAKRGPSLAPAWPQRIPEAQVDTAPKDESGTATRRRALCFLPRPAAGRGQTLRSGRLESHCWKNAHAHDGRLNSRPEPGGDDDHRELSVGEIPAGTAL